MFGNIFASFCFISLDLFFLVLAVIIRLIPSLSRSIQQIIRFFLGLSTRFYRFILTPIAPALYRNLGINIFAGLARVTTTILLSLFFGLIIFQLSHVAISGLAIGLCILHGLIVGLIWEGFSGTDGINLGDNIDE